MAGKTGRLCLLKRNITIVINTAGKARKPRKQKLFGYNVSIEKDLWQSFWQT